MKKILDCSHGKVVPQVVRDALRYRRFGTVLDFGAGSGKDALFLARKGFRVTAMDRDRAALALLRKTAKAQGLVIPTIAATFLRFSSKSRFDVVLANNTLHFLKEGQVARVIAKLREMTKDGGLNVISVHTDRNEAGSRPYLFKTGELKGYYADWKILKYEEKLGRPYRPQPGGKTLRKYRASLIARKPEVRRAR